MLLYKEFYNSYNKGSIMLELISYVFTAELFKISISYVGGTLSIKRKYFLWKLNIFRLTKSLACKLIMCQRCLDMCFLHMKCFKLKKRGIV